MPRRQASKPKRQEDTDVGSVLQLKIRLLGVSPMVWRRVLVPVGYTLQELHGVVQVAMGWESLHLYHFLVRAVHYGSWELGVASAAGQSLAGWRHEIRVEDQLEPQAGQTYPSCLAGEHACPPEECGGPAAYEERRSEVWGLEAMEDLGSVVELVKEVLLNGKRCRQALGMGTGARADAGPPTVHDRHVLPAIRQRALSCG